MKVKSILKLVAAALLLSTLNPQPSTCFAQGSLTPPGAPGPMMKTLDQLEPRTPISSAPITITTPGSYYLTTNVTVSTGDAITIAANNVTLDLKGFTISSTAASATGYGIKLNAGLRNITIQNGFIVGGVTNNGSGVYSGSGFRYGIYNAASPLVNVRVSGVSVSGCLNHGINLENGESTVVESCTVRTVGNSGIVASTIKSCSASDCGRSAIYGDVVADSQGFAVSGPGYGIYAAQTAQNCHGENEGNGFGVDAGVALNCYGWSGSSAGVLATSAQNCYGGSGSGSGVAANILQNCYGYSGGSGSGLEGATAQNCLGESDSGSGVYVNTAQNCYGSSTSGTGLYASDIAIGCKGYSSSGTGVRAYIANSCRVGGGTTNITFKYNMP